MQFQWRGVFHNERVVVALGVCDGLYLEVSRELS